ncbi:hypothetical protein CSB45_12020 [candidate division KSB3 bacterium]|uniref:Uncharacterized protein n=1 Tax=candidate division KSB3 bacterium TaxID=2044937 RepID=A0A2G6E2W6_9BACT|nr:MAG: hypothetical protein CSB45_12020 [candidate division KSB3 bacterium]PIE28824.1 MAG: hypothetical protein CSA57_11695 [candidate division KSB3 bacterium]
MKDMFEPLHVAVVCLVAGRTLAREFLFVHFLLKADNKTIPILKSRGPQVAAWPHNGFQDGFPFVFLRQEFLYFFPFCDDNTCRAVKLLPRGVSVNTFFARIAYC